MHLQSHPGPLARSGFALCAALMTGAASFAGDTYFKANNS